MMVANVVRQSGLNSPYCLLATSIHLVAPLALLSLGAIAAALYYSHARKLSQICRFCWHHIKQNLNGRCPACRRKYSDNTVEFKAMSQDE